MPKSGAIRASCRLSLPLDFLVKAGPRSPRTRASRFYLFELYEKRYLPPHPQHVYKAETQVKQRSGCESSLLTPSRLLAGARRGSITGRISWTRPKPALDLIELTRKFQTDIFPTPAFALRWDLSNGGSFELDIQALIGVPQQGIPWPKSFAGRLIGGDQSL